MEIAMYIVSAAMEKGEARAALYDGAYTLLVKKEGKDLAKLLKELLAEGGVDASAVAYVGAATDNAEGSPECFAAELEKEIGIGVTLDQRCNCRHNVAERGKVNMIFIVARNNCSAVSRVGVISHLRCDLNASARLLRTHNEKRNPESYVSCSSRCVEGVCHRKKRLL